MAWQTGTSLFGPPPPWDLSVMDSRFEKVYREKINRTDTYLILEGPTSDAEWNNKNGNMELRVKVGDDEWIVTDGGKRLSHPKKTEIHPNSGYGLWIDHAIMHQGLREVLASRGDEWASGVWKGIVLRLTNYKHNYGGDIGQVEYWMPLELVRVMDEGEMATWKGAAEEAREAYWDKVRECARQSTSHDEFVTAALQIDGVSQFNDLTEAIVAEEGEGSIWAEVQGAGQETVANTGL